MRSSRGRAPGCGARAPAAAVAGYPGAGWLVGSTGVMTSAGLTSLSHDRAGQVWAVIRLADGEDCG